MPPWCLILACWNLFYVVDNYLLIKDG
jgi:hypothetical protein